MYLLGTFGIPLFLLVNGFLLYERDITPDYVWKKLIRYIKFILMWTIIIGILELVLLHKFDFWSILRSVLMGGGKLYHFWFIAALASNLILYGMANYILKKRGKAIQHYVGKTLIIVFVILMSLYFMADIVLAFVKNITLGEMIIAPLNFLIMWGYSLIGMSMHKVKIPSRAACIAAILSGYLGICVLAQIIPLV